MAISDRDASGGQARGKVRAASQAVSPASSTVARRTTPVCAVLGSGAASWAVLGAGEVSAGEVSVAADDAAVGSEVTART
jgi:hypothetical protein